VIDRNSIATHRSSHNFQRWHLDPSEFGLPSPPRLNREDIETLALRVHDDDDIEALAQLQTAFFPLLCSIVKRVERDLRLGEEIREDELDATRSVRILIPPWRYHPTLPGPREALEFLLGEFHLLIRKRWKPQRGPFSFFLHKFGRRLLEEALHRAIAQGAPDVFRFDSHKRRAFLRHERVFLVSVPEGDLEFLGECREPEMHTTDTASADPLRELALASQRYPDYVDWTAIVPAQDFQVIVKYLEADGDPELAADLLRNEGRDVQPQTVERTKRRILARVRRLGSILRSKRKVEGKGEYALTARERVKLRQLLQRSLGEDGDFTN